MKTQQKDKLIDVPEICAQLGVGKSTVYELFAAGKLEKIKLGRSTKVSELQVQALIKGAIESGKV